MLESARDLELGLDAQEERTRVARQLARDVRREATGSKPSSATSAAMPARPSWPGIATPYTFTSRTPGQTVTTSATSLVATFSPFHRNVSPMRSTKYA